MSKIKKCKWAASYTPYTPPSRTNRNARATAHTTEEWDEQRPRIEELYRDHGYTIMEVKEILGKEGFAATEKQLRTHLKEWGGNAKYLSKRQAEYIAKKVTERSRQNLRTSFRFKATKKKIPSARIRRIVRHHVGRKEKTRRDSEALSARESVVSSQGISAYAPSSKGVYIPEHPKRSRSHRRKTSNHYVRAAIDESEFDMTMHLLEKFNTSLNLHGTCLDLCVEPTRDSSGTSEGDEEVIAELCQHCGCQCSSWNYLISCKHCDRQDECPATCESLASNVSAFLRTHAELSPHCVGDSIFLNLPKEDSFDIAIAGLRDVEGITTMLPFGDTQYPDIPTTAFGPSNYLLPSDNLAFEKPLLGASFLDNDTADWVTEWLHRGDNAAPELVGTELCVHFPTETTTWVDDMPVGLETAAYPSQEQNFDFLDPEVTKDSSDGVVAEGTDDSPEWSELSPGDIFSSDLFQDPLGIGL